MAKLSSLDANYTTGDLSIYPEELDSEVTLYEAKNNAETTLSQSVSYNSKYIVVENTEKFPDKGLIRLNSDKVLPYKTEVVYYGKKTKNVFSDLSRGFAGSYRTSWDAGDKVSGSVMSEHHNALKDAIIKIEENVGVEKFPSETSLNWILKRQEARFLSPKPIFRSYPLTSSPGKKIKFKSFSSNNIIKHFWDFGDGTTSIDESPIHSYSQEGIYTVKLNVVTTTGGQAITTKTNYINISINNVIGFFYVSPQNKTEPYYSLQTATALNKDPQTFNFVDQTDTETVQRYWIFDDGDTETVLDPNKHSTTHVYEKPGIYSPALLLVLSNQKTQRIFLNNKITII